MTHGLTVLDDMVKDLEDVFGFRYAYPQTQKKPITTAEIETPGVKRKDISVKLKDGFLSVVWVDRHGSKKTRSYWVDDVKDVDAVYNDGLLKLTVKHKKEYGTVKEIELKGD